MKRYQIKLIGLEELEDELQRLNSVRFDAVAEKQVVQMLNRARASGGTPVDTGELRQSSSATKDEMGYGTEYAPHVEFGHRIVVKRKKVGYVEGQYFLSANLEQQRPIYKADLKNAIAKEGG